MAPLLANRRARAHGVAKTPYQRRLMCLLKPDLMARPKVFQHLSMLRPPNSRYRRFLNRQ